MDEPPLDSYLSVTGCSGLSYSTSALQLNTELAVWSEIHSHIYFIVMFSIGDVLRDCY